MNIQQELDRLAKARETAQARADDLERVVGAQRGEIAKMARLVGDLTDTRNEHAEAVRLLSASPYTRAGQSLPEAVQAVLAALDAAERRLGEALAALDAAETQEHI